MFVYAGGDASLTPNNPSFDYSPCKNSNGEVVCSEVPFNEVQRVFRQTNLPALSSINLIARRYIDTFIPEDVLVNKRTIELIIEYPIDSILNSSKLQVHPNAFRSTKNFTKTFILDFIDCTLLDFDFLSGFMKLTTLTIANIINIEYCLSTLPSLPSLITLNIQYSSVVNEIAHFPKLVNGLKKFSFYGNENFQKTILNDETADRMMNWLLLSSAKTLEELTITENKRITKVPHQISSFPSLRKLWLSNNSISIIKTGEFTFSSPVSVLNIWGNGIKEIEPGAFQGKYLC